MNRLLMAALIVLAACGGANLDLQREVSGQ